jgi:probable HAF family extracellular repeat protein
MPEVGGSPSGGRGGSFPDGGGFSEGGGDGGSVVAQCGAEGQSCCSEATVCESGSSCDAASLTCRLCSSFTGLAAPAPYTSLHATGVSANAQFVVGYVLLGNETHAFRWSARTGFDYYPDDAVVSEATAVSEDGSVVVGNAKFANDPNTSLAYRWTSAGVDYLPLAEGAVAPVKAADVSADGSVVVGNSLNATGDVRAWRWQGASSVDLGPLLSNGGSASRVSADGHVIVGDTQGGGNNRALRFTWDPLLTPLAQADFENLVPLMGDATSFARGVSADGELVVGRSFAGSRSSAVRWDADGGTPTPLPELSLNVSAQAFDVSEDGRVAVGLVVGLAGSAVFWDANGIHSIQPVLVSLGVTAVASWELNDPGGVSRDGRVIAGDGKNPDGVDQAWVAVFGDNCSTP